jgi:hypothetical protein
LFGKIVFTRLGKAKYRPFLPPIKDHFDAFCEYLTPPSISSQFNLSGAAKALPCDTAESAVGHTELAPVGAFPSHLLASCLHLVVMPYHYELCLLRLKSNHCDRFSKFVLSAGVPALHLPVMRLTHVSPCGPICIR